MLFLGSLLSTALSGLFILSLANLFFRVPSVALVSILLLDSDDGFNSIINSGMGVKSCN